MYLATAASSPSQSAGCVTPLKKRRFAQESVGDVASEDSTSASSRLHEEASSVSRTGYMVSIIFWLFSVILKHCF